MRLITSTALLCAGLEMFAMTSPTMADSGTGTSCEQGDAQGDVTIQITMQSGKVQAVPNAICVTHNAHVKWVPDDPAWIWFTLFADDNSSPFGQGKILHGKGNDHDDVKNCPHSNNCSYTYYGLVIIGSTTYLIDPMIIVNPNARPPHKKKERDKK